MDGKEVVAKLPEKPDSSTNKYSNISFSKSKEDSMLRVEVEKQDKYSIAASDNSTGSTISSISSFLFFTPLKGMRTNNFILKKIISELILLPKKHLSHKSYT